MTRILILSTFLSLLHVGFSSGQSIQFGVSAGVSVHDLDFEAPLEFWDPSNRAFPAAMLHAELPMRFIEGPLGRMLWLSSGIRYTRLASRVAFETELGNGNQVFSGAFQINQHYLAIPVQFRLVLGKLPVYLLAGPEFGILLYANRTSDTFTPVENQSSDNRRITNDLRRINTSIYGGIGVYVLDGFALFGRYGRGMSDVLKPGDNNVSVSDWLTNEFEIGLKVDFER